MPQIFTSKLFYAVDQRRRRDFTLHVGYPRTGTTFVQREVLPQIRSVDVFAKPQGYVVESRSSFGEVGRFFRCSPRIWHHIGEDLFSALFGPPNAQKSPRSVLVSDESVGVRLTRTCSYVGSSNLSNYLSEANIGHIPHLAELTRLAENWGFGRVRVIVVIRRQDTWIPSAYVRESQQRDNPRQEDFRNHVRALLDPKRRLYEDGVVLDYHAVTCGLFRVLGANNVLVLPFEMMVEEPGNFFAHWAEFLNLSSEDKSRLQSSENWEGRARRNARSLPGDRWVIHKSAADEAPAKETGVIELTESLSHEIRAAYRTSNEALSDVLDVDLQRFGYC